MVTAVVGSIAASARSAACCGVAGSRAGRRVGARRRAGRVRWVAVLARLSQIHRSRPLRITSGSPSVSSSATRCRSGAGVPDPQRVRAGQPGGQVELPSQAGSRQRRQAEVGALHHGAGQPVEAGGLQVDQELGGGARRQGGSAPAANVPTAAPPPITATAAATGTSQRRAGG